MGGVKPAPPPVHVDEAEAIRLLVDGPDDDRPCAGTVNYRTGIITPCSVRADWGLECSGCGQFMQVCTGHREWSDRQEQHGARRRCSRCRRLLPTPSPWGPL